MNNLEILMLELESEVQRLSTKSIVKFVGANLSTDILFFSFKENSCIISSIQAPLIYESFLNSTILKPILILDKAIYRVNNMEKHQNGYLICEIIQEN